MIWDQIYGPQTELQVLVTPCNMNRRSEFKDIHIVRREMRAAYRGLKKQGGWRAVGKLYDISPAMAWRIVEKGYEPTDEVIRTKLGLPAYKKVPVCPVCGEVHLKKSCTHELAIQRARSRQSLFDWPVADLRDALENREEI